MSLAERAARDEAAKKVAQRKAAATLAAPAPEQAYVGTAGGLPSRLRAGIERLSGLAMDGVRVHRDSAEPAKLGALAYTKGSDIHLGPGQEQHLPHEAWHVVQQKQGRVAATRQCKSRVPINDSPELEREADALGARALSVTPSGAQGGALTVGRSGTNSGDVAVQCVILQSKPPPLENYLPFFNDSKVWEALKARAEDRQLPQDVWMTAFTQLHKGEGEGLRYYTVDEALDIFVPMASGKAPLTEQPDSLVRLHDLVPRELENYMAWLFDEPTWAGRSDKVLKNLPSARSTSLEAHVRLTKAREEFPLLGKCSRLINLDHEKKNAIKIAAKIDLIRETVAYIDTLVTEPPVPPKSWDTFMGDEKKYVYADGVQTPIPVTFYKSEDDYAPIVVPVNKAGATPGTYKFPDGPRVRGRKGWHNIVVKSSSRFGVDTVLKNAKEGNARDVQVDINFALQQAGVSMGGKDGDHVRDLGFGGTDTANNYWPLAANINRRPFLGWRGSYGVNYVTGEIHKTASITALTSKKLRIAAFMSSTDGNVPALGLKPDPLSGAVKPK